MKKIISKILGTDKLLAETQKSNILLAELLLELKRNSDLVAAYNKAYKI